ncbi:hypothetical protein PENSPDRAFT_553982, partial [Peniophora sp. CONT]
VLDTRFNAPDAEIILRSSDNIDFAVHKSILQFVAPVFSDMLSLPPAADTLSEERPVVEMEEDSDSLRLLLSFSYPRGFIPEPALSNLADIKRSALMARKYDIEFMRDKAERALIDSSIPPAVAYAVSWRFEYSIALRKAARRTLEQPNLFRSLADSPEFSEVSAVAFIRLWHYH